MSHGFGLFPVAAQPQHGLGQCLAILRRNDKAGLVVKIDIAGAGADLARDHGAAGPRRFQQRNPERFRAQMRRQHEAGAQRQQCFLVGFGDFPEELHIGAGALLPVRCAVGAGDDHGQP